MNKSRRGLKTSFVALACSAALTLSACGGGEGADAASSGRGEQLDIQFVGPPVSMNPAFAGSGGSTAFVSLAYDPLIYMAPDGSFVPSLATEWGYTDDSNTAFELTIRDGVKFADGENLTPEAVKESLEYFLEAGGPQAVKPGPVESIEASESSVTVNYSEPFPDAEVTFTQEFMFGNIISPSGIADPDSLLSSTQGTGQYQLVEEETIADSEYVYDRNEDYWAPDAQMFEEVAIKIIPDPNAVISAVSTGQVDVASGSSSTLQAAEAAGLDVVSTPFFNWTLYLADKEGTLNPALKDDRVRQAMAMAINREAIVNAVGSEVSVANGQLMNRGTVGYVEGIDFDYDPEEAKQLLADAGYADGFELTILTQNTIDDQTTRSQAIADSLEQIGIDVNLEVVTTGIANFSAEAQSKEYEAVIFPLTGSTMGSVHKDMLQAGLRNPFGIVEPEIEALYEESLTAPAEERVAIYEQMSREYKEQAYVIPVFTAMNLAYVGPEVTNVKSSPLNPTLVPTGPEPQYSWQPKQ